MHNDAGETRVCGGFATPGFLADLPRSFFSACCWASANPPHTRVSPASLCITFPRAIAASPTHSSTGRLRGPAFGLLLGGALMQRYGWRPYFIALGAAGFLWIPLWLARMPRSQARCTCRRTKFQTSRLPRIEEIFAAPFPRGELFSVISGEIIFCIPADVAALLPGSRAPVFSSAHGENRSARVYVDGRGRRLHGLHFGPPH